METHLKLVLTQCRRNKPLVSLTNLHLLDADMTPEQLRKLAGALNDAATLCEARALNCKHLTQVQHAFSLVVEEKSGNSPSCFRRAYVAEMKGERDLQRAHQLQRHSLQISDSRPAPSTD